jgi:hypothetical protein
MTATPHKYEHLAGSHGPAEYGPGLERAKHAWPPRHARVPEWRWPDAGAPPVAAAAEVGRVEGMVTSPKRTGTWHQRDLAGQVATKSCWWSRGRSDRISSRRCTPACEALTPSRRDQVVVSARPMLTTGVGSAGWPRSPPSAPARRAAARSAATETPAPWPVPHRVEEAVRPGRGGAPRGGLGVGRNEAGRPQHAAHQGACSATRSPLTRTPLRSRPRPRSRRPFAMIAWRGKPRWTR